MCCKSKINKIEYTVDKKTIRHNCHLVSIYLGFLRTTTFFFFFISENYPEFMEFMCAGKHDVNKYRCKPIYIVYAHQLISRDRQCKDTLRKIYNGLMSRLGKN